MLKFSCAIVGLLAKYRKDTFSLAEACKLPEPVIYDWRCGRGQPPAPGHILKLARAFATSPQDVMANHLKLLYAHLRDDCAGPAAKYINIEIVPTALPVVAVAWSLHPIHRRSELDLEAIRKHLWYDEHLQRAIRQIANPLKSKPVPKSLDATGPARDTQPIQDPPGRPARY